MAFTSCCAKLSGSPATASIATNVDIVLARPCLSLPLQSSQQKKLTNFHQTPHQTHEKKKNKVETPDTRRPRVEREGSERAQSSSHHVWEGARHTRTHTRLHSCHIRLAIARSVDACLRACTPWSCVLPGCVHTHNRKKKVLSRGERVLAASLLLQLLMIP